RRRAAAAPENRRRPRRPARAHGARRGLYVEGHAVNRWAFRTKLMLWSALTTTFTLVIFGVVAAVTLYGEQLEEVDRHLAANATEFVAHAAKKTPAELADFIRRDDEPHFGFAFFTDNRVV